MPRPPQNVRIARLAAVLELDDAVRETGAIPDVATVGKALGLAKNSATDIRRHIARRHGVDIPRTRTTPLPELANVAPPPPATLTPSEMACYRILANATAALPAAAIYADAMGYPKDRSSGAAGREHIQHMRAKGVSIDVRYGVGYWLAEKAVAS